jgi:predicted Zn-dependent protease with MMP-like domain
MSSYGPLAPESNPSDPVIHDSGAEDATARTGMEMDAEAFEALVTDELDRLPDDMVDGLENLVFVVEDAPESGEDLFGVYEGFALTERGQYGMGELPDRIVVYRHAHLAACRDESELRDEVHTTLVHEIAHFYGIDDAQLHELGWA